MGYSSNGKTPADYDQNFQSRKLGFESLVSHKLYEMESPFLVDYLKNVGNAVHSINTIVVGLSSIESGEYKVPEDLTIGYETRDNVASARKSRKFALKSSMIFIEDSLSNYLKDIRVLIDNDILISILSRSNPQFNPDLNDLFQTKYPETYKLFNKNNQKASKQGEKDKEYKHISSADRIRALNEFYQFDETYWIPCIVMLIKWRNKIVHRKSKTELNREENLLLKANKEILNQNHANIDIEKTIYHFNNNDITLKDATTLIAVSIRFARFIDEQIFKSVNKIEIVEAYVERNKIIDIYNAILSIENERIKKRKFENFVLTNISPLNGEQIQYLYENSKLI